MFLLILFFIFSFFSFYSYPWGIQTNFSINDDLLYFSGVGNFAIIFSNPKQIYNYFLNHKSWKRINRFKKHQGVDSFNCSTANSITPFAAKWLGFSGIYKITLLPFRLFTYYGASKNLGQRIKDHYTKGKFLRTHLGLAFSFFGINCFSFTIVELCSPNDLKVREDWYLNTYSPLLNMLTKSSINPKSINTVLNETKQKISNTIRAKGPLSEETKRKMSDSKKGS